MCYYSVARAFDFRIGEIVACIRFLCLCLFEFSTRHCQLVPGERKLVVGYDLLVKQCLLAPQLDSCRFHFCLCRADIGLRRA
mgnify:CR=1 FL=1